MKIKVLQAVNGDSILLSFADGEGRNRNILIDGGTKNAYETRLSPRKVRDGDLKLAVAEIREAGEKIDLLILTHVDDDHIGGILKWFEKDSEAISLVERVWFNSGKLISEYFQAEENDENLLPLRVSNRRYTGIKQGITFENLIEENGIWDRTIIKETDTLELLGFKFTILSPDADKLSKLLFKWKKEAPSSFTSKRASDYSKTLLELVETDKFEEDAAIHNGSSIAFFLEDGSKRFLFLGDAHPSCVAASLKKLGFSNENPLKADLVKVSHHGSKGNTSYELLELIDCDKFVISSNGAVHNLPDKLCLARIINAKPGCTIYFNYPEKIGEIFTEKDFRDFDFQALPLSTEFLT
jgi:beta-lactamase superfamily II metal-dependent hydrolase